MFGKDIGIDLGTANILIYVKGEGIVLNEPSVVAVESNSKKVLAVGEDAYKMLGRTPGKVEAIKPLQDGVIANFELTVAMLNHFIKKVQAKNTFSKPTILICCPTNIIDVEEEPKVAAVGAGLDISKPNGSMVIDIGGGTTDIAILSLGDIVTSKSLKVAGNVFDQKIIDYIKEKYKLLIGERTAEEIKIEIGSAINDDKKRKKVVKGRNLESGLPCSKTIVSSEIYEALESSLYEIIDGAKNVLETTLPELSADIVENGVVLTGGGAMLDGLDKLLNEELKIPVKVAESPLTCVVDGTGIMLINLKLIEK